MCLKLVTLLLLIFANSEPKDSDDFRKVVPGFFLSLPKVLLSGTVDTVCLSTHYSSLASAKIIVDIKIKDHHYFTTKTINGEHSCFQLHVPHTNKKDPQLVSVRVQVHLNDVVYSAHNQDPVVIFPDKKITFVETDRVTYKSEDAIKIRILTLGHDLLPLSNHRIPYVKISNPLGVGVAVWENVSTELGLAQLDYELSKDPVEGKWKIDADGESRIFEVSRYVLPRFKVDIIHPRIIYHKSSSVTMKVCAKYSHGGVVKGAAFIRLTDPQHYIKTIQTLKKMSDGCADFNFSNEDLTLTNIEQNYSHLQPRINILITATVTEYGTDKIELTTSRSYISLEAYSMKFVKKNLFLPGLPYQGVLEFNNINTDLTGEVVEICYNIAIKKSWNYLNTEQCSNFTVANEKSIQFHILPLKHNVIHLQLNARSLNHTEVSDSLLVVRLYSPSSTYLVLNQTHSTSVSQCRSMQQFSVQYTTDKLREHDNITFFYMIRTRGQIFKLKQVTHNVRKHYPNYFTEHADFLGTNHRHVKNGTSIGKFVLKFKLDDNIISNYNLLVYFVTEDGEVVSATKEVEVEPCLNNKVEANWSHRKIAPGGTAALLLETKSDSLCSVSAVDKSVTFMDDLYPLDTKSFLKPYWLEHELPESSRKACIPPAKKSKPIALTETHNDLRRRKRFVFSFSEDYDAYDVFNKFGVTTITNFKIVTKPCYTGPKTDAPVQSLTDQYELQNDDKIAQIRSFFPETWLWELIPVRKAAVIHRNLPHTITSWVTNVLCVSATDGVGFSKTTEITTFQPFFVDVLTPHSIKRGETLYLHTVLFNYLSYNIPIRLSLSSSKGLQLVNVLNKNSYSYCVNTNSTVAHVFELKGIEAGTTNVTVLAELDSAYPGHCGPEILVNQRDVVFKTLIVEPEGYPVKISKSALLCGSDNSVLNNITWTTNIPDDVVIGTSAAKLTLNGDILGQTIENLNDLIVLPTGCGEQIMASLAPNLYVLKYLNATNNLTPSLRRTIFRNLKIGYQRILNYLHKDGSFSAFGFHDPSGSMFLTAFVVRTLQEARQYIYVDHKVIERAVAWILNHQLENGCFSTMLHVFQDMGGTTTENSTAGLTSYVMISLLDANITVPETVKTNAKYCIRGHYHLDKYTLAISSYALLKVNWYSEANRMLKKLMQISSHRDNMMWWTNREVNGSIASDVEITSYVLLSMLHQKSQENLAKAHSIVRWLVTKQSPKGSFHSTQDSVVALDALAKYSTFVGSKKTNLNITLNAMEQKQSYEMTHKERLKSKKIVLKNPDGNVRVGVEGDGCVLVQSVVTYNLKHIPSNDAFKLDMEIMPVSNIDECSIALLTPCFTYSGPDQQANMAILEVDLPSGYAADRASLYKLIDDTSVTKVKMFEELEKKVVLYLTKLDTQQVCINFNIHENAVVESRTNSTIKLYDYYKPEYSVSQFYKVSDKCKPSNLTLPSSLNETRKDKKRDLNSNFVDVDFELAEPEGVEGNKAVYVRLNSSAPLNYASTQKSAT